MVELKKYFDYVLSNYLLLENANFSRDMKYYKVIVNNIPSEISKLVDNKKYKIYGSCGKGTKSASPYVTIMDRTITTTPQIGLFVDFIFKSDMSGFYLAIDQGIKGIKQKYGNKASKEIVKKAGTFFKNNLSEFKGFKPELTSDNVKEGSLEDGYDDTRIIAKYYSINNFTNEELINDLKTIMSLYEELIEKMNNKSYDDIIESIIDSSSWPSIYKKIALKVLEYNNDHSALINLMYDILIELDLFSDNDEKNCNLDKFNGVRCRYDDIDPFSFMNRLDIFSEKNRKGFIKLFQEKTGLNVCVPDNFDGIPSVNPKNTFFIRFKDERDNDDVSDFWKMFEIAVKYLDDSSDVVKEQFISYYDKCISKPGCSYNLTMGLFRIDANYYLNLDSTNRMFIKKEFGIDITKCPSGKEYLDLIDLIKEKINQSEKYNSIIDFSKKAWLNKRNTSVNYWTYSPGENASEWEYCLNNNKIVIGWDLLGELTKYNSKEDFAQAI